MSHKHTDKIKNEVGGACRAYGERGEIYRLLVGKTEKKITPWKAQA
jgi:hypothetical protein